MKRTIVLSLIMVFLIIPLQLFASSNPSSITVGGWGGNWDDMAQEFMFGPLKEKLGISANMFFGGSADIFARIEAQKADPQVDVVTMTEVMTLKAISEGLLWELRKENVPNIDKVWEKALMDPYGPAILFAEAGIIYNKETVKDPITSWHDLWREEFKGGRVALPAYGNSTTLGFLALCGTLAGSDIKDTDAIFDLIEKLEENVIIYSADPELEALIERGEVDVALWYAGPAWRIIEDGYPYEYVRPEEGIIGVRSFINVVKNCKNRDGAESLINQYISAEAQKGMAENIFYGPTHKDVKLDPDVAKKMPYGEDAMEGLLLFDWAYIAEVNPIWQERWMKIIH